MNAVAKRDYRFDNAKFLLIFLVVLGHVADNYCDFYAGVRCLFLYIYTFHMPAFLYISGLFSKHLVKQEKLNWKRLIPYPVLCIFLNFFRNFSLYLFDHGKNFHLMKQDGVSWFLWVLFVFYILTWLIKDFPKKNVLLIAVAFALLAGYDSNIGSNFALSRMAVFYPFFYLGYSTKLEHISKILDNKVLKIISPFWLVAYGIAIFLTIDHGVYWFRKFFTGQNSYKVLFGDHYTSSLRLFMEAPVYRLATLVITFVTLFAFLALVPKHKIFALTTAGSRTLAIYFWHLPIATVLMNVGVFHRFAISSLKNCCIFMFAISLGLTLLFSLPCFSIPLEWITRPGKRKAEKQNKRDGKKLVSQLESQQQEIRKRERLHEPEPITGTTVHAAAFNPSAGITVDQIVTADIILGLKSSGRPENIAFGNTLLAKRLHIDRLQEEDPVAAQHATEILKSGIARSMQRFQALQEQTQAQNQTRQPQVRQQQTAATQQSAPEQQPAASPEHISSHPSLDDLRHLLDLNI
jgi:fucose 4-O-acetylase-like acetyltransferase